MTVIELTDKQAEALKAKAAAQGLTLEMWLRLLAEQEPPVASCPPKVAAARILELQKHVKPDPDGWTVRDYFKRDRP